jgi:hypothetical protein
VRIFEQATTRRLPCVVSGDREEGGGGMLCRLRPNRKGNVWLHHYTRLS